MHRPPHIATLLSALQFQDPRPECLLKLNDVGWKQLLAFSDNARLTLILAHQCRTLMPEWARERVDRDLAVNTERLMRAQVGYEEICEVLTAAGADHLVLKGFAQWPYLIPDARLRPQSDLDLYCPPSSLLAAQKALLSVGYEETLVPERDIEVDHLPLLLRVPYGQDRTGNPDPTLAIELHFQFWNRSYSRFGPTNLEGFWTRRSRRNTGTLRFNALDPMDAFAYSALHALRHLLYGNLLPLHIYELAFFLHQNKANDALWNGWLSWHDEQLRSSIAVPSLLASKWFRCCLPDVVSEEIGRLPAVVPHWFDKFGDSTLVRLFQFNKEALWLHLSLIDSARERRSMLRRRLIPLWMPPLNSPWVQHGYETRRKAGRGVLKKCFKYAVWFLTRVVRHLSILPSTLWAGLRLRAS
jgi:hypothetical protein